jgi:glycerol kinase
LVCQKELRAGDEQDSGRAMAAPPATGRQLTILPFRVSERAPTWVEDVRGTIIGVTASTSAQDVLRATRENEQELEKIDQAIKTMTLA